MFESIICNPQRLRRAIILYDNRPLFLGRHGRCVLERIRRGLGAGAAAAAAAAAVLEVAAAARGVREWVGVSVGVGGSPLLHPMEQKMRPRLGRNGRPNNDVRQVWQQKQPSVACQC